jgi:phage-related protein
MDIVFFRAKVSQQCPVRDFIQDLEVADRAKILACLKSVETLGFDSPRVQFRQIRGRLWEIKIQANSGYRVFYVCLAGGVVVLLHAYRKQSQKAPVREIKLAEKRLNEVLKYEKDYT